MKYLDSSRLGNRNYIAVNRLTDYDSLLSYLCLYGLSLIVIVMRYLCTAATENAGEFEPIYKLYSTSVVSLWCLI